jgi:hypothetical protein
LTNYNVRFVKKHALQAHNPILYTWIAIFLRQPSIFSKLVISAKSRHTQRGHIKRRREKGEEERI